MLTDIYTGFAELNSNSPLLLPAVALLTCSTLYLGYIRYSDEILYYGLKIFRTMAGMRVKYVPRKGGKGVWCYAEKGEHNTSHRHHHTHNSDHKKYPTLVFLHGFGSDKDTWPSMIMYIPKKYHCIILDLPGHGETTFVDGLDYCEAQSYVESVHEFLQVIGLDKTHIYLIGCSFGGAVAGLYAHDYPKYVSKLGLLCPASKTPVLTETCKKLINGKYELLIPTNGKEFCQMIALLACKPQHVPERIMHSYVNLCFTPDKRTNLKKLLTSMVVKEFNDFEKYLEKMKSIKSETLIIWGENDEMLHVSGAQMINEKIKGSKLKIIKNCNHVIQLDNPRIATKALVEFI